MARTYKRDSRGRFAGGGGGSSGGRGGRPATKRVQRGTNRLTRDNSGKITGQGGSGATARGGRLKTASGNQRATQLDRLKGRIAGTVGKGGKVKGGARMKSAGLNKDGMAVFKSTDKPAKTYKIPRQNRAKPVDLSQGAFERRAKSAEKRARAAEKVVAGVDRYNPSNRKLVNRANSLRSAADSYSAYARRGRTDPDFSAGSLFQRRTRSSTAPKLTRSEKAAATRRANADKRFRENVRRMEQSRRYG